MPAKNIVFRADASLSIGTGHVMRCLALADILNKRGFSCHFICRSFTGNLIALIQHKGYRVHSLALENEPAIHATPPSSQLAHAAWLGTTQENDAALCLPIVQTLQPLWVIIDHYALDTRWEATMRPYCNKLMVIDDLADREHYCNILIDPNLGHTTASYEHLVSPQCKLLIGPTYALLRPEFMELREYSITRRSSGTHIKRVLVALGGVDQHNATGAILNMLPKCSLPVDCHIWIVMGAQSPNLELVRQQALLLPWPSEVLVDVTNMAQRMADCDIAIGAAGGTSWERCCLGVPTLLVILAANQRSGANALARAEAAALLGDMPQAALKLPSLLNDVLKNHRLDRLVANSIQLVDGQGAIRISDEMMDITNG